MLAHPEQLQVLRDFGYLPDAPAVEPTPEQLVAATKQLQSFYGLEQTGQWDESTARVVTRTPRCGLKDVGFAREAMARWGILDLNYHIASYVRGVGMSTSDVDGAVRWAWDQWESVCGIKMTQVKSADNAHIVISKGRGRRAGFDGPSGTLAYAYLPNGNNFRGQLQMLYDEDEPFSLDGRGGTIDFRLVTLHEDGHLLGMDHSPTPNQVMNPTYNQALQILQAEDAQRGKERYGNARLIPAPTPGLPPPSVPGSIQLSKLEVLLRLNGQLTIGPFNLDLNKRAAFTELLSGNGG